MCTVITRVGPQRRPAVRISSSVFSEDAHSVWWDAFMPALLRILFSRTAISIRYEIVPKTRIALKQIAA
jgi:hypothetical protein